MAYVKGTLAPGEDYLYRAHFNWTYDFASWAWFAFASLPMAVAAYAWANTKVHASEFGPLFYWPATVAFALGLTILLVRYIHKWTTVIAVTTMRLVMKTGMLKREAHEVNLDKIEEVEMHQSFLGHLVGFGKLAVRGTGVGVIEFPVLGKPMEIRREIEAAAMKARNRRNGGGSASKSA